MKRFIKGALILVTVTLAVGSVSADDGAAGGGSGAVWLEARADHAIDAHLHHSQSLDKPHIRSWMRGIVHISTYGKIIEGADEKNQESIKHLKNVLQNVLPSDDIERLGMLNAEAAIANDEGNIDDETKQYLEQLLNDTVEAAIGLLVGIDIYLTSTENITTACRNDTLEVFAGIAEAKPWALRMFDASGKPAGGMFQGNVFWYGNYDQCLDIKNAGTDPYRFNGKYCTAIVDFQDLVSTQPRVKLFKILEKKLTFATYCRPYTCMLSLCIYYVFQPIETHWGFCVPSSCSENELKLLESDYLDVLGFRVQRVMCDEERNLWGDPSAVVGFSILMFFVLIMFICTIIDASVSYYNNHKSSFHFMKPGIDNPVFTLSMTDSSAEFNVAKSNGSSQNLMNSEHKVNHVNGTITSKNSLEKLLDKRDPKQTSDIPMKIVRSFSVYTNLPKLLNSGQTEGTLTALHGIRFLSMSWVILGHTYLMGFLIPGAPTSYNMLHAFKFTQGFWFQAISNGTLSVDTFFVMSGMLVTFLFLKQLKKMRGKISPKMIGLFYFHRFWRLTPLYMMCIMIFATVYPYMGRGPFWDRQFDSPGSANIRPHNCRVNWWTNLLYINNLVHTDRQCIGHSWYLANDMQFFIISPLIIIPLYLYPLIGLIVWTALFITCFVVKGVLEHKSWMIGQTGQNPDNFNHLFDVYMKPYCRIGAYLIGMLTGFILYHTDCKVKLKKVVVLIGWCIAIVCCMSVLYGEYSKVKPDGIQWSGDVQIMYQTLMRPVWSIGVAWMMFACVSGYGGIVNTILSWSGWVPLARLTFAAYLIHPQMIYMYIFNRRTTFYATQHTMVYLFFGHMVASYGAAVGLTLLFESPMMGLEKIFLPKPKKN